MRRAVESNIFLILKKYLTPKLNPKPPKPEQKIPGMLSRS